MKLTLRLLGPPEIQKQEMVAVGPASAKARALLYYLATTRRAHTRTQLAGLLWGDHREEAARANLRKILAELDEQMGDCFAIERQTVSVRPELAVWVDAVEFATLLNNANAQAADGVAIELIQQALALYQGDFLEGFYVRQAPDYEGWMLAERARLRQLMVQGLETVAIYFANHGDLPQAIANTRRLLALEPWREETHRHLMTWLARDGQRSAALAQYESCRQLLADELGVAPSQATQQLYERLQQQDRAPAVLQHLTTTEYP